MVRFFVKQKYKGKNLLKKMRKVLSYRIIQTNAFFCNIFGYIYEAKNCVHCDKNCAIKTKKIGDTKLLHYL